MSETILRLSGVSHAYAETTLALADLDLDIAQGELAVIVGPSGSGKSTLLRAAAGLLTPSEGSVTFKGEHLTEVPDGLSMVFQDYGRSLFPWLRVGANVEFGLPRTVDAVERRVEKGPDHPCRHPPGRRRTSLFPHRLDGVLPGLNLVPTGRFEV